MHFLHGRYAFMRGRYDEARAELEAVGPESRFHAFAVRCAAASTTLQSRQFSALACRAEEGPKRPVPDEATAPARERADSSPLRQSDECKRGRRDLEFDPGEALRLLLPIANGTTEDSAFCRERSQAEVAQLLFNAGRLSESFDHLVNIARDPYHDGHDRVFPQIERFLDLNAFSLRAVETLARWYPPNGRWPTQAMGSTADEAGGDSAARFIRGRYAFMTGRYGEARAAFDAMSPSSRFYRCVPNCAALSAQFEAALQTLKSPASPQ